jgi:hypothetical protein
MGDHMSNITGIIVIIIAIACMYQAQRKTASSADRRLYSLLGSVASVLISLEALNRHEAGVCVLFALAAAVSLATLAVDFLKPSNR